MIDISSARRGFLLVALLCCAVPTLQAQLGFENKTRVTGELLTPGGFGWNSSGTASDGRGAIIAFHGGLLYTSPETPSSAGGSTLKMKIWDISSDAKIADMDGLALLETLTTNPQPVNAHGYTFFSDRLVMGGDNRIWRTTGYQTYDVEDFPDNLGYLSPFSRGRVYPRIEVDKTYWSYGEVAGNQMVEKYDVATNSWSVIADWDHLGDTGVVGQPFIMGEWLIMAAEQSRTGVAVYDLSPCYNGQSTTPNLIGLFKQGPLGGYWPEIWGEGDKLYVVNPRRLEDSGYQVIDISDPSQINVVADVRTPLKGMYVQFQDNYAFVDNLKIDMHAPDEPVLVFNESADSGDMSQFQLPIGNLLVSGGQGSHQEQAWRIWAHQSEPDTQGPKVGYHRPRPNQENYPVGAPVSMLIHETLQVETIDYGTSFSIYEVDGNGNRIAGAVPGIWTLTFDDILTFMPDADWKVNTTYEVEVVAGGIKDAAGNGIEGYSWRFSTGGGVNGANFAPDIAAFTASPYPVAANATTTFTIDASDSDGSIADMRIVLGDSNDTGWIAYTTSYSHTYPSNGHYDALLQVRDNDGSISSKNIRVTVMTTPAGVSVANSSQIITTSAGIWAVNPDNNSVVRMNAETGAVEITAVVGADPRSIAEDASGRLWVPCHDEDAIYILNGSGAVTDILDTGYGSGPMHVAISPDGVRAYVTMFNSGFLKQISTASLTETGSVYLGPTPRAIAIKADASGVPTQILVTRFISPAFRGEVWNVDPVALTSETIALQADSRSDGNADGHGVPNYLAGVTISPDGRWAYVPSKKDNVMRGQLFNEALDTDNSVRAIVSVIDLNNNRESFSRRRDIDNADSPTAVAFSPLGDYAFVALQGINQIQVIDALELTANPEDFGMVNRINTGLAPQGLVFDAASGTLWSKDFMDRSVTRIEASQLLTTGSVSFPSSAIQTVDPGAETLASNVLNGKRIFYNAADTRMSAEGYISCATCHVDGMHDGQVWDFTQRGEGLRNTTDLRGRAGTGHGNVHWSGNFDEIQDFVLDIVNEFGGSGFPDGVSPNASLGASNAGDPDLDDLAAYVTSLGNETIPKSPWRNPDGSMTTEALAGKAVFESMNCASCHDPGSGFTDSALGDLDPLTDLHDVGTISATSGQRLGAGALPGLDTPTLYGVWDGAPFMHDGTANTLEEFFAAARGTWYEGESGTFSGNGGAKINADWPAVHGAFGNGIMWSKNSGDTITLTGIDGGSGGMAEIRLRYSVNNPKSITIRVNGTTIESVDLEATIGDNNRFVGWNTHRFFANLNSGSSNQVVFQSDDTDDWAVDAIRVSTSDDFAAATDHRQVVETLNATDQANLLRYLRELDGRDENGDLIVGGQLFAEGFENWNGWNTYQNGSVEQSSAQAYSGTYSLRKFGNNDPSGGYKLLGSTIEGGFVLEGWLYNETPRSGGSLDRLSLADSSFNGYGVNFGGGSFNIERRTNGGATSIGTSASWSRPSNAWYRFKLTVQADGVMQLEAFDTAGVLLGTATATDTQYSSFDRVVIHGGHTFYVDDLTVSGETGGGATVLASDDSGNSVNEGGAVTIDVLANDTGSGLTVDSVTQGSLGSVSNNGGNVTYTPNVGVWSGSDSFTYVATDGSSSDSATVGVSIVNLGGTDPIPAADLPVELAYGPGHQNQRQNTTNGTWEISRDGAGFDGAGAGNDALYLLADNTVSGDFQAVVQLVGLTGPSGSRMGLMLRDGNGQGARFVAVASGLGDGYKLQSRSTAGAAADAESDVSAGASHTFASGKWVLLQRVGNTVTVAVDDDDSGYTEETSIDVSSWSNTLHVGLFTFSGVAGQNAVGEFDNYSVNAVVAPGGGNIVVNGDVSQPLAPNSGTTSDVHNDLGWTQPGSPRWTRDATNNWLVADDNGAQATVQIITDQFQSTGIQTIAFDARNTEGSGTANTLWMRVWGTSGSVSVSNWNDGGPSGGVLLYDSGNVAGTTFDWSTFTSDVDFGSGYEKIVVKIYTLDVVAGEGDSQAVDNVSIAPQAPPVDIVINGDLSQEMQGNSGSANETYAGLGWTRPGSPRWTRDTTNAWLVADDNGAQATTQVILDDYALTGEVTVAFDAKNTEGSGTANTLWVRVYGVNGPFSVSNWNDSGPGSLLFDSGNVGGSTFDWTQFSGSADFGAGYEYYVVKIYTLDVVAGEGDFQAIDNVKIGRGF